MNDFEKIMKENKFAVIDFYATWCVPCRKVSPIIDELERNYGDEVSFLKLDVEENDDLVERFGIKNVPTVLFLNNGEVVYKIAGSATKDTFVEKIETLIADYAK